MSGMFTIRRFKTRYALFAWWLGSTAYIAYEADQYGFEVVSMIVVGCAIAMIMLLSFGGRLSHRGPLGRYTARAAAFMLGLVMAPIQLAAVQLLFDPSGDGAFKILLAAYAAYVALAVWVSKTFSSYATSLTKLFALAGMEFASNSLMTDWNTLGVYEHERLHDSVARHALRHWSGLWLILTAVVSMTWLLMVNLSFNSLIGSIFGFILWLTSLSLMVRVLVCLERAHVHLDDAYREDYAI